jgi:hypothetical protein
MRWHVTIAYLENTPDDLFADTQGDLCAQINALAKDLKRPGDIEFEGYTDEVHSFLVRGKRRRPFVFAQCEG